ncbi:LacI family DNA-binding transcriptional regulator [Limosilactobacillus coleohominis]|uniref:LacI family DNA-binding transcriptional regulator n=1 Tax=Limosilactobacillus coleohominis TaxID=181675 RepID=A0ABS2GUP6_9LACO|nr:LacI family DNA-binding transcriptional regulator [Limosilactobacillus coleohominis]MBM6940002.1 LacI family DNA-binding transcriptional regulator [Limosilactobacillus coleohominis]
MKATIKDVAKAAHVSTATVSRVLSNKKGTYREDTAKVVRKVSDELGYHRNISAAELASNEVKTIAIIINNTKTNFWQKVLDGIQAAIKENHRNSIIFYAGNNDEAMLTEAINSALARSVSGILLIAAKANHQQLQLLNRSGLPYRFVSIYGSDDHETKFISSNNIKIGELATQYLINHGHTRIGLIGIDKSNTGKQRLLGYEKVMTKANQVVEPGWIQYGNYSFECGEKLFKRVRNLGLTAVIAASDMTAAGILKAAHQYGYQIPQDLSIISIDGTFICNITAPQLTSISQEFEKMGRISVENLIQGAKSQFIPVNVRERESVQNID